MRTLCLILLLGKVAAFASAQPTRQLTPRFLCDAGGFICVPASVSDSVLQNPVRLPVYVNRSDFPELTWEIRDATGKVIDTGSTAERMDWGPDKPAGEHTFHILDFILTAANAKTGTMTIKATPYDEHGQRPALPALRFPVRLTMGREVIRIREPQDAEAFQSEVYQWVDTAFPKADFHSKLPFKSTRLEVMRVAPNALLGITAAAVISRYPGQSTFYVTDWSLVGHTAHVGIDGSGWAGVSHYSTMLDSIVDQSLLALPGIKHVR